MQKDFPAEEKVPSGYGRKRERESERGLFSYAEKQKDYC